MSDLEKLEAIKNKYLEYEKLVKDNKNKEIELEELKNKKENLEEQKMAGENLGK